MKFFCIADVDTVRGFRLAGVEGRPVETPQEVSAALDEAVRRPDVGIVILTDTLAESVPDQVGAVRMRPGRPQIVVIPGPAGPMPGRKTLRQFVQEAVGIQVGGEE